jgi:hypothetical protein
MSHPFQPFSHVLASLDLHDSGILVRTVVKLGDKGRRLGEEEEREQGCFISSLQMLEF